MNDDNTVDTGLPSAQGSTPQNDDTVSRELNTTHEVGEDRSIEPNTDLSGYQDDLATGDNQEDVVQYEQSTSPSDVTTMPEDVLKEELDVLAVDEKPATSQEGIDEDRREHIEDMDENDKARSEG